MSGEISADRAKPAEDTATNQELASSMADQAELLGYGSKIIRLVTARDYPRMKDAIEAGCGVPVTPELLDAVGQAIDACVEAKLAVSGALANSTGAACENEAEVPPPPPGPAPENLMHPETYGGLGFLTR